MTTIRFLQRHRRLGRLLIRGPIREWVARRVWAELERDDSFNAAVREGLADIQAGRLVPWSEVRR